MVILTNKKMRKAQLRKTIRDPTMGGIKDGQTTSSLGANLSGMTVGGIMTHTDGTQLGGSMPFSQIGLTQMAMGDLHGKDPTHPGTQMDRNMDTLAS